MKICAAQIKSVKGDIRANIEKHKSIIELAISNEADVIVFPELSITGYEPTLAKELAIDQTDYSLNEFQTISNTNKIIIGIGLPTKNARGICISMILFHPDKLRQIYSKQYLHADEEPFFVSGKNSSVFISETNIALAICYEVFIPEHAENAFTLGANMYLASVAKSAAGVQKAGITLPAMAKKYSMPVLMTNCVGYSDNFESAGGSAIWSDKGLLLAHLNDQDEGILLLDTNTNETVEVIL